jgi:hypothetical protein
MRSRLSARVYTAARSVMTDEVYLRSIKMGVSDEVRACATSATLKDGIISYGNSK